MASTKPVIKRKPLHIQWLQGVDKSDLEKIESSIRHSTTALTRLRQIVAEKRASILRTEQSLSQYQTPNWDYLQAHINGRKQELHDLEELLSFLDQI